MGDISQDIQSKFSSERVKALINVMYTAHWISNHLNVFFKPFDLSPQQYNILRILRGAEGPIPTQIVKERMIDRAPNATRLMDKLCAKGLMRRKACAEDRRVVHVEITKAGLALLDKIGSDPNTHLLKNLSQAEAKQLSALLDKIR